jgi:hypothetical protein
MKKYEYLIVNQYRQSYVEREHHMNELGKDGWLLVSVFSDYIMYFVREKEKEENEQT